MVPAKTGRWQNGIARRLVVAVVLFSSLITLIATAYQLYRDYNRDLSLIDARLQQIQDVHLRSIAGSLWVADEREMQILVEGIHNLPDMLYLEIKEREKVWVSVGLHKSEDVIVRQYPLTHTHLGREMEIGMLTAVATLEGVYQRLIDKAVIILVSNGIKTFLVSGFILLLFHFLVTQHLVRMANFVRGLGADRLGETLTLRRAPNRRKNEDEFDQLTGAFNEMQETLRSSYKSLRESEERFRDFTETGSDWYWETDAEMRFTYIAERYVQLMGLTARTVIGRTLDEVRDQYLAEFDKNDTEKWRRHKERLGAKRSYRDFVMHWVLPDGERRVISVNGKPLFDSGGAFLGYRGTCTDITDVRSKEEQLRQAQKMEAIGQLTGGIAHDFNNLLSIILWNLELLADSIGEDKQERNLIERATSSTLRGAKLISRMMAFARKQELHPRVTDLGRLIAGMTDLLERTLEENIEVETVVSDDLWRTFIDAGQLENALINLALNARDSMPAGGHLVIEVSNTTLDATYAERHAEVTPGDYVMVSVSDTGHGIAAEHLDKVFDPFFTTKEVGEGSGLGLSMVYGFVKQSEGHLKIYSEVEHGATVKIYFPRTAAAVEPTPSPSRVEQRGRGEIVLVVEDDADVRQVLMGMLRRLGYEVLEAANGPAALTVLEKGEWVDLLFTDVVMPGGMTGAQLVDRARALRPHLPVLFTSGYTASAATRNGLSVGGADFVSKPAPMAELALAVRKALNQRTNDHSES